MKTRFVLAPATILVLLVASSLSVAAAGPTVPFKASYECLPQVMGVENGCLVQVFPCAGDATHLGESTLVSNDARSCFDTSQHGNLTFTADNGDHLFGYFEGNHQGYPGPVTFGGKFWITGGDGRLAGATGTGRYWGTADGGKGLLYFNGKLTK